MADTHLSFEEFRKERNRALLGDKIKALLDDLALMLPAQADALRDAIGERLYEYGEARYDEGLEEGKDYEHHCFGCDCFA